MKTIVLTAAIAALMCGCVADRDASHRRAPPQDPPDYHGVPTDDRPPAMLEQSPRQ